MKTLTIGRLAKKVNVNIETIRYYERRGLIPEPPRSESGYRHYSQDSVARIRFIIHAKELGFSLKEVSELLSLRVDRYNTCNDVKRMAEVKITDIEEKVRALLDMKNALMKLKAECNGRGPVGECPILEALEAERR
jgi:MerR family mercuric resistance operon transcriptional regulator